MSKRAQIRKRLEMLAEIGGIMGAMKNIALMETRRLSRYLACQHRVLAGIETAAADFLDHYPGIGRLPKPGIPHVIVAIGSQRGFCGDFNEPLLQALRQHNDATTDMLVVGRRLASRLGRGARIAEVFDGPSVTGEIQPVLRRLMDALGELQARSGATGLRTISVLAHREGESQIGERPILPAPPAGRITPHFPYPPLLNLEPQEFFAGLARHYLWAQMHDVFYSSLMAENRRRLQHLENAMQRMEEKAGELRRRSNLLRQEEITEEIEIIMLSNEAGRRPKPEW